MKQFWTILQNFKLLRTTSHHFECLLSLYPYSSGVLYHFNQFIGHMSQPFQNWWNVMPVPGHTEYLMKTVEEICHTAEKKTDFWAQIGCSRSKNFAIPDEKFGMSHTITQTDETISSDNWSHVTQGDGLIEMVQYQPLFQTHFTLPCHMASLPDIGEQDSALFRMQWGIFWSFWWFIRTIRQVPLIHYDLKWFVSHLFSFIYDTDTFITLLLCLMFASWLISFLIPSVNYLYNLVLLTGNNKKEKSSSPLVYHLI